MIVSEERCNNLRYFLVDEETIFKWEIVGIRLLILIGVLFVLLRFYSSKESYICEVLVSQDLEY